MHVARTGGSLYIEELNRAPEDILNLNALLVATAERAVTVPRGRPCRGRAGRHGDKQAAHRRELADLLGAASADLQVAAMAQLLAPMLSIAVRITPEPGYRCGNGSHRTV